MRQNVRPVVVLLIVVVLLGFSGGAVPAQSVSPAENPGQFSQRRGNPQDDTLTQMQKDQEKQRNKDRHQELKKDTDKLLELATELKLYVDKSNENMLSLDVVRKADEIEKLARNVKQKMKGY